MTGHSCPEAWKVEAVADGRLHEATRGGFFRHLDACESCRRYSELLVSQQQLGRALPFDVPDAMTRRRMRQALLREASGCQPRSHHRGTAVRLAAAIATTGVLALATYGILTRAHRSHTDASSSSASVQPFAPPPNGGALPEVPPAVSAELDKVPREIPVAASTVSTSPPGIAVPRSKAPGSPVPLSVVTSRLKSPRATQASASHHDVSSLGAGGQLFVEGVSSMRAGEYATAERLLNEFLVQVPTDSRAEDASYLLLVCCQRRGDGVCAQRYAKAYVARFPNGLRSKEARTVLGTQELP